MTTEEYFAESDFSVDVFKRKYAINDKEQYEDAVDRVTKNIAKMENYDEGKEKIVGNDSKKVYYWWHRWKNEILDDVWKPAGSIMAAVGSGQRQSTFNCTTVSINGDTLEDIAEARYKLLKFAAYREGIGVDFTPLRPAGSKVNNSAKVSNGGAINWMADFNDAANHVGQSGRRPAFLFSLHDDHPDFPEFIKLKSDLTKIPNANISVQISDAFMNAVANDEEWVMTFKTPHETIVRKEKTRKLFDMIVDNNLKFAEPGIQFRDTIHKFSNSDYIGKPVVSSNACFSGNMMLLTDAGNIKFDKLVDKKVNIINKDGNLVRGKVWYSGKKDAVELSYISKKKKVSFIVTPDQVFMTNDGKSVEAKDMAGKKLMPYLSTKKLPDDYIIIGFAIGDGQLSRLNSNKHLGIEINIGKKDIDVLNLLDEPLMISNNKMYVYSRRIRNLLHKIGAIGNNLPYRDIPAYIDTLDTDKKAAVLRGLFSANGYAINSSNFRIGLKSTNNRLLEHVARILNDDFGISSYITYGKEKEIEWENGVYVSKRGYDLNISAYIDIHKFYNEIGFIHKYKNEIAKKWLIKKAPIISNVKYIGKIDVYDFSEPLSNWGVVNGFVVHNCSEKFLDPSGACNLCSINFEKIPTDKNDIEEFFKYYMPSIVRFMDNVISYEEWSKRNPIEEQKVSQKMLRRLGIGFTNLHAWLLKAGVEYGSKESVELLDFVMHKMMYYAYKSSIELGKEKGSFKAFDKRKFIRSPYVQMMMKDGLEFDAMRNVELLAIAPSGSLSTQISKPVLSYGIEPAFGLYYWKRTRISGKYEYYFIVPNIVYEILKENGIDLKEHGLEKLTIKDDFAGTKGKPIAELIDKHKHLFKFKPAREITVEEKLDVMAAIAKYIDSSISTTYILPETGTKKDVEKIIFDAWKRKIKSVAIYRDSTRYGIIEFIPFKERVEQLYNQGYKLGEYELSEDDLKQLSFNPFEVKTDKKFVEDTKDLARIYKFKAEGNDKFYVILKLDETEVFITNYKIENRANEHLLAMANRLGKLVKEKNEKKYYKQLERSENTLNRFTRMLSTALKLGLKDEALEILEEYAFVGNLAWYLTHKIFKRKRTAKICPVCGTKLMDFAGCWKCPKCGYEKCE